jgi:hypothetical protein
VSYYCVLRVADETILYSGSMRGRALECAARGGNIVMGEGSNLSEAVLAAKKLRDAALKPV